MGFVPIFIVHTIGNKVHITTPSESRDNGHEEREFEGNFQSETRPKKGCDKIDSKTRNVTIQYVNPKRIVNRE